MVSGPEMARAINEFDIAINTKNSKPDLDHDEQNKSTQTIFVQDDESYLLFFVDIFLQPFYYCTH